MLIGKFKETRNRIYGDIHAVCDGDMRFLRDILGLQTMEYGRIKTYSAEDSRVLALYTLKHNAMVLLDFMFRNRVEIDDGLCTVLCDVLLSVIPSVAPECFLEVEEVKALMDEIIIDILCGVGKGLFVEKIERYLGEQEIPDRVSVNLAVVFSASSWRSYDLRVVNELILGPVLLGLLRSFKDALRPQLRNVIVDSCKKKLRDGDRTAVYQIFYELNGCKDLKLMEIEEEEKEEAYVGFVCSLMVDTESCLKGYEVISRAGLFGDLKKALETINTLNQMEYRRVRPEDERLIFHLLEVVEKLISSDSASLGFVRLYFMRFIELFLNTLVGQILLEIKGMIYAILAGFMRDEDAREIIFEFMKNVNVFSKDVVYADFEREMAARTFAMAPRFLRFCMYLDTRSALDFAVYALRSEDPSTVIGCFNVLGRFSAEKDMDSVGPQLQLMSQHIRAAMLASPQVISRVLDFQLGGVEINDVSIINVILSTPNPRFFQYVRLFDDFSFFMNENFLERLAENEEDGFRYLCDETKKNHEVCKFVVNNQDWFNAYSKEAVAESVAQIYENLVDFDIENVDAGFSQGFIVPDIPHPAVFRMLGKLILYAVYVRKTSYANYITDRDYDLDDAALEEYCSYIKCRIVVGDNVEDRVKHLMKQHTGIDDLLGYYKICTGMPLDAPSSRNLLVNMDRKDTSVFVSLFPAASDFEKFLLFFFVDVGDGSKEVECIVREEVTHIMISGSASPAEKMVLRQCLTALLSLSNIDSIVRLVPEYEDVDLLLRINIRNIMCGGTYFNSALVMKGALDLQVCAVFLLYYKAIWDLAALRDWILHLRKECKDNDTLEYLIGDVRSRNIRIELD